MALALLMILAPLAGCTSDSTPPANGSNETTTHSVNIDGSAFNPPEVSAAVGDTVTWTNNDSTKHTATADDGTFDSDDLSQDETYSYTFDTAGSYAYKCSIHSAMTGTITVA